MATVYSGWVGGDDWQVRLDYNVVNVSNTQCRVDCTAYVVSQYGSMSNSTHCVIYCDGQQSSEVTNASFGTWTTKALQSWSFTVARPNGTAGRTISVSARIWALYGPSAYASGATASGSATVPARQYLKPNPPSGFKASRVSDVQMSLTWQGNYTGMDGDRPWTGIYVDRRTDDGDWQNIANLSWNAVNYTDNSTGANHKYEYRLCAYGPGGNSDHVEAPALYTTPAAPASVAVSRVSGTSVRVSADVSTAPYAESFEVQRNLNSGGWKAVDTVEMFPITDDAGGGTAVYRVRSVIGSLRSAWTESDPVTTIVPPLAPSVTVAGGASVVPTGTDLVVTWVPNHPDGSAQTAAQVNFRFSPPVIPETTKDVSGSATSYKIPAMGMPGTMSVRVRTKGADEDWGAWSGWVSVTVARPPAVHFSVPPVDGAAIGALPLTVEWDVTDSTGVASQSIALLDASGRTLYSAEPGPKVRELVLGDSTYRLSNATDYRLRITVRGGSSLTATAERSFRTSFAEPARPTAQAETDPSDMSVAVSVQAGAASSASGEVIEVPATPGTLVPGFTVFGNTRQNLWVNPSGTANGVTVTANANGSITLSGTATSANIWIGYVRSYVLRPGSTYTLSVDGTLPGWTGLRAEPRNASGSVIAGDTFEVTATFKTRTFTVPADASYFTFVFRFSGSVGTTLSGTYRIMLNEGSEPEPWCPPGLNGVDELSVVCAGKNLAKLYSVGTKNGVTTTVNDDGSITVSGTNTGAEFGAAYSVDAVAEAVDAAAGREITVSLKGGVNGLYLNLNGYPPGGADQALAGANEYNQFVGTDTIPDGFKTSSLFLGVSPGFSGTVTVYPQLELSPTATAYEPPAVTTTPVDLEGHALNSLPDGTRDELRIDGTGACKIVQRVGVANLTSDSPIASVTSGNKYYEFAVSATSDGVGGNATTQMCDRLPIRNPDNSPYRSAWVYTINSNSRARVGGMDGNKIAFPTSSDLKTFLGADGITVLYPLAEPQEAELPGVSMPSFPADPSTVFCASNVPCAVQVDYPATASLTVQRVAPDGSRWTVADGLLSGQQAIDPLPPLNIPYSYEVTASTEAGSAYTLDVPHEVETVMAAFNFGAAAAVAELARLGPSWSHARKRAATLYHFADGGESGGLPVAYGSPDVDGTLSQGFTLLDMDQLRRLQAEARLYPVCWFRDPYGGRYLVYATWDFKGSIPWDKVEVTASMTETVFEEAW